MPIRSFRDKATAADFAGHGVRSLPPAIQPNARRKPAMIDATVALADLAAMTGNRLERLAGDRADTLSIRVNRQWRICFRWSAPDAFDVGICDYHR
jgi:proteic killer suppression protein